MPPPPTAPAAPPPRPVLGAAGWLDRGSLVGIALGVALVMQPWWAGGFRAGFFVVLGATLVQIVASHLASGARA